MKKWVFWGLAMFGGLVLAAIVSRASKTAKETGGKATDIAQNEIKSTIKFS